MLTGREPVRANSCLKRVLPLATDLPQHTNTHQLRSSRRCRPIIDASKRRTGVQEGKLTFSPGLMSKLMPFKTRGNPSRYDISTFLKLISPRSGHELGGSSGVVASPSAGSSAYVMIRSTEFMFCSFWANRATIWAELVTVSNGIRLEQRGNLQKTWVTARRSETE
jgi:hypothetical protein